MKPMTTYTDEDVLNNDPPSPWKKITPSRGAIEEEEEPGKLWGWRAGARCRGPDPEVFPRLPLL